MISAIIFTTGEEAMKMPIRRSTKHWRSCLVTLLRLRVKDACALTERFEATLTSFRNNHLNGSVLSEGLSRSKSLNFHARVAAQTFVKMRMRVVRQSRRACQDATGRSASLRKNAWQIASHR